MKQILIIICFFLVSGLYSQNVIERSQYWFNNNFEEAVTEDIETPAESIYFSESISTLHLSDGLHTFHIRFKDSSGKWSSTLSNFFYKLEAQPVTANNIVEYQYWLNNDFDNAVTAVANHQHTFVLNENIDFSEINNGLHTFHIRFKDCSGRWSSTLSNFFYKLEAQPVTANNIVEYQYWLNNDFDNAVTAVANHQQTFVLNENIDFSEINNGLHTFHIRFKDCSGRWSSTLSNFFYKVPVSEISDNKITSYRYWIDEHIDEAILVVLDEPINPFNLISMIDLKQLSSGDYMINLQFLDENGLWSSVLSEEFTVLNPFIVSVDPVEDIEVHYGTDEAGASEALAAETQIHDSFSGTHNVTLTWFIDGYDGEVPGDYFATGTFDLPDGVDQSDPETALEVTAKVTVLNPKYELTLDVHPEGAGSVYGYGIYKEGSIIEIATSPGLCWVFDGWTGDTEYIDNAQSMHFTFTMPATDISLTATFVELGLPEELHLADIVISDGETVCYEACPTINVADFIVETNGSVKLIAGQSIHLLPGTKVNQGGYLLARIAQHEDDYCGIPRATEIAKEPVASKEDVVSADFSYEVRENGFFKLYPNPTDGTFTLELTIAELVQTITVEVHSMLGGQLITKELPPQRLHTLSLEGQQPGMYIIRVMKGDKLGVERLIKR